MANMQSPYSELGEATRKRESGKIFKGGYVQWKPTYLYLTMIELLVPLKG